MKAYYKVEQEVPEYESGPISKQLKICVACGSIQVVEYDLGISCNNCGTCFYFGRINES